MMAERVVNGIPHASVATYAGRLRLPDKAQEDRAELALARLAQALSGIVELKRELAASQQELKATQQLVTALVECNSGLEQQLIRLVQQCEQSRDFACYDELTGLPNRRLLKDRFDQAIARAAREHKAMALLLLDLNGFKTVNDTLGHAAGDKFLQQVAKRLTDCIRVADTACRYGGDEFIIMLPEIEGEESVAAVAKKIHARLAAPFVIDDRVISGTASIGTALYPMDGETYTALMKRGLTSRCIGPSSSGSTASSLLESDGPDAPTNELNRS
jgi:diguanylate cyclase (GGDEF)-like protein